MKGKEEDPGAGRWAEASAGWGMGRGDGVRRDVKMAHKDLNESFWRKKREGMLRGGGGGNGRLSGEAFSLSVFCDRLLPSALLLVFPLRIIVNYNAIAD